jgi:hypothetical protein
MCSFHFPPTPPVQSSAQIAENNTGLTAQRQQGSDKPDLLHLRSEGYHIRASSIESSLKRPRGD